MDVSASQKTISVKSGQIATYTFGDGPSVIFLHGGPGDTHNYMKRMAEPLFSNFRCIFFDQRGTGGSGGFQRTPEQFRLELLFEDLKAIQEQLNANDAILVGHSWGAMYALYSCMRYPGRFQKAALLNMGPLDKEMERATSEHLISVLNDEERSKWQKLRKERNKARNDKNITLTEELDRELMQLRVKAWIFDPTLRELFLADYFQDPSPDREINNLIWEAQQSWFSWSRLGDLQTSLWLCVGANDSVPVAQAERIAQGTQDARLSVLERCGHIPWLEHPQKFYPELIHFLRNP